MTRMAAFLALLILMGSIPYGAAQSAKTGPGRLAFAGRFWQIRTGPRPEAPGGNFFDAGQVSVLPSGGLRLSISRSGGQWRAAEVELPVSLGYGTYEFLVDAALDRLDPNLVLGLFTYSDSPEYFHREIDIEFAAWSGRVKGANAQYAVQPAHENDGLHRFLISLSGPYSFHRFRWEPGRIAFESFHGHEAGGIPISSWTYEGANVPVPGGERVHMNLYLDGGKPPTDGKGASAVISDFRFAPYGAKEDRP